MIPWIDRPVIYDVRARPHLVESTSGSRDLQMVIFFSIPALLHTPRNIKGKEIPKEGGL